MDASGGRHGRFVIIVTPMRASANAVLEANAEVDRIAPFPDPHISETPEPILMSIKIYHYLPQGTR